MDCKICGRWHCNILNLILHGIAFLLLIYGVWIHSANMIISAVVLALIGHIVQGVSRKAIRPKKRK